MAIHHTSRTGKTYYLHTGPKRGGGVQYFFSTQPTGALAAQLPDGFEIHESVHGQVFLRRTQPRLLRDEETACIERGIATRRGNNLYKVEVRGDTLTVFESTDNFGALSGLFGSFPPRDRSKQEELREQFASYQPVLRFILVDRERRLFAPERYCFRGSVDDWISIGPPEPIERLAAKYLKHLGQDSMFELF
jgi:hypothetical protein